jgi:hypothetical protein
MATFWTRSTGTTGATGMYESLNRRGHRLNSWLGPRSRARIQSRPSRRRQWLAGCSTPASRQTCVAGHPGDRARLRPTAARHYLAGIDLATMREGTSNALHDRLHESNHIGRHHGFLVNPCVAATSLQSSLLGIRFEPSKRPTGGWKASRLRSRVRHPGRCLN